MSEQPHVRYYKQQGSQPKEEITREEFFAASEVHGMTIARLVNYGIGDVMYSFKHIIPPDEVVPSSIEITGCKKTAAHMLVSRELLADAPSIDFYKWLHPTRRQRMRTRVWLWRRKAAAWLYCRVSGRALPEECDHDYNDD